MLLCDEEKLAVQQQVIELFFIISSSKLW